jgi:DNA polymerase
MDDAALARLVAQHAMTSRLLGVDFVPAFRRGGADEPPAPQPPPAPDRPAAAAPTAVLVEPKARPILAPAAPAARDRELNRRRLDELRARYEAEAPHQHFITAHTRIVFGEGDPAADLVFVGEAPGEEEDRTGRPFVGKCGQLLNKMIAGMGLRREDVYICNILKTRPPNNATPTTREIELCEPYLREQLGIISPRVIVCLGLPASRAILKTDESMAKMRGRWRQYVLPSGEVVPTLATYHPSYVLRNYTEQTRRLVWSDLRMAMERLGLAPTGGGPQG